MNNVAMFIGYWFAIVVAVLAMGGATWIAYEVWWHLYKKAFSLQEIMNALQEYRKAHPLETK